MKKIFYLSLTFLFSLALSAQSFEMYQGDTINKIDNNNRKQGHWRIKNKAGSLQSEGVYKDSRKEGLWKTYYDNGKLKSEITEVGGRPNGSYKLYYLNGNVEEVGNWAGTKNTGSFERYHKNGKIAQEFNFLPNGRRNGIQKYYHENGQLQIVGNWNQGQENGELKEYYDNGDLKSIRNYDNGTMDVKSYKEFASKQSVVDPLTKQINDAPSKNVKADGNEKPNIGRFDGNGYYILYNSNKQISKDGVFKNYRFVEGKMYEYDDNGIITSIKVFKKGRYVGDGVMSVK